LLGAENMDRNEAFLEMAVRYRASLEQMSRECHASSILVWNVHTEDEHCIETLLEAAIHSRMLDYQPNGRDLPGRSGHKDSHRPGTCKLVA